MKKLVISILALQFSACAHDEKTFEKQIGGLRCEEASQHLPGSTPLERSADGFKYVAKNMAAYSYITANYTTEVLWDATTGTILYVGLCGIPMIALAAATNGHFEGSMPPICIPHGDAYKKIRSPPLGRRAVKVTQIMRCPDLASVSNSLKRVADCYEQRGDPESLKKAIKSLENIESSKDFFSCLAVDEQTSITTRRENLQKQVAVKP